MRPADVCLREVVRVAKAQVYVGLSCEMKDGIDVVAREAANNVCQSRHITIDEFEVGLLV